MKKLTSILVFFFVFTLSVQAQKKQYHKKNSSFNTEQIAILKSKKMALHLDLSEKQQQEIRTLLLQRYAEKKAMQEKIKLIKKEGKKPTQEERYQFQKNRLDKQITFKKRIKRILDKNQYEKFEKMMNRKSKVNKATKKRRNIKEF